MNVSELLLSFGAKIILVEILITVSHGYLIRNHVYKIIVG